jgi:DNA-binding NarL/FixJ family response regulator
LRCQTPEAETPEKKKNKMISTAIIEDNQRYRQLLEEIIGTSEKATVVFASDNCNNLIVDLGGVRPDVMIMDIDLPGKSGIEGTLDLKKKYPQIKVLILTVFEDEDKIFSAIKAGADGYLLKKDPPQKILDSVQDVFEGKSSMNGVIAKKVLEYFQKSKVPKNIEEYHLTPREHEILNKLMDGLSYKELASDCHITVQTLNSHIKNIYHKLGVHSRAEISARFRGN